MIHNLRFVKAMYELEIYRAYYGTIMDKVMVTASDLYFTEALASYGPSNLYSLMCGRPLLANPVKYIFIIILLY